MRMPRLTLLRHAKSSWDVPDLSDHERQLTKRGTKAAKRIARYITENDLIPDLILCSDAIRTRATLALILACFDRPAPHTIVTEELYLAAPDDILRIIKRETGDARHVMVIGHNPGLHALALSLPGTGPVEALTQLAMKFPTAALAHISFDISDWAAVGPATGTLEHYVMPRSLPG